MPRSTFERHACEFVGKLVDDGVTGLVAVADVVRERLADPQVQAEAERTLERPDRALGVRANLCPARSR